MKGWMTKDPPKTDAEIELIKRQIETQLNEYEEAIMAYGAWIRGWRAKRAPRGFRRANKGAA